MPTKNGRGMPDAEEREKEQAPLSVLNLPETFWGIWNVSSQAYKMGALVIIKKDYIYVQ